MMNGGNVVGVNRRCGFEWKIALIEFSSEFLLVSFDDRIFHHCFLHILFRAEFQEVRDYFVIMNLEI